MMQDKYFDIALKGLKALVKDRGENSAFPFDAVWSYTNEQVPGKNKPHQAGRLTEAGYLELTGGSTRAETPARAGSPTREYRPGPKLRSTASATPAATTSVVDAFKGLEKAMAGRGFVITAGELANFYLALLVSPLVIMTGISGTGKSRLPRLFAELIGATFASIPVKPQWDDNSDLFGYTSNLNQGVFVKGEVTSVLQAAAAALTKPSFVLLDEMNLAAVEHYFSDFLSVIETRRRSGASIITDALPIDLPQKASGIEDAYAALRSLYLPNNVRVVGTANMDETTRNFSPKVLDRAFSIEFNEVDLTAFPTATGGQVSVEPFGQLGKRLVDPENPVTVGEGYKQQAQLFDDVSGLIEEVRTILEPARLSFGYRPRDASCLYMWHWKKDNLEALLPYNTALDYCILQKVLPKIYGQGERLRGALENLERWLLGEAVLDLEDDPARKLLRSAEKVKRMRQRLDEEGATTYWGV
jgi:AAA domain (dynein-related subfamily)